MKQENNSKRNKWIKKTENLSQERCDENLQDE
jgi:hypothetical protein